VGDGFICPISKIASISIDFSKVVGQGYYPSPNCLEPFVPVSVWPRVSKCELEIGLIFLAALHFLHWHQASNICNNLQLALCE